jgi:hypothetical protein
MRSFFLSSALLVLLWGTLSSQERVDSNNLYERVLAVVPMTGSGTWSDPKRPVFAPARASADPASRSGIIAWQQQTSDDGAVALVEFVFATAEAANQLTASLKANPSVKVFHKGKDKREDIEKALKALRKDFDLDKFAVRVP